jgi:hypothetical protein
MITSSARPRRPRSALAAAGCGADSRPRLPPSRSPVFHSGAGGARAPRTPTTDRQSPTPESAAAATSRQGGGEEAGSGKREAGSGKREAGPHRFRPRRTRFVGGSPTRWIALPFPRASARHLLRVQCTAHSSVVKGNPPWKERTQPIALVRAAFGRPAAWTGRTANLRRRSPLVAAHPRLSKDPRQEFDTDVARVWIRDPKRHTVPRTTNACRPPEKGPSNPIDRSRRTRSDRRTGDRGGTTPLPGSST